MHQRDEHDQHMDELARRIGEVLNGEQLSDGIFACCDLSNDHQAYERSDALSGWPPLGAHTTDRHPSASYIAPWDRARSTSAPIRPPHFVTVEFIDGGQIEWRRLAPGRRLMAHCSVDAGRSPA
jgi:hypothetical protein